MTNLMSARARDMRRDKGAAEAKLWRALREFNRLQQTRFRQQAPVGPFIADFCDHTAKLVIEVDGGQHATPEGRALDARRAKWLNARGYRVLRFWNNDVLTNLEGVLAEISITARSHCGNPMQSDCAGQSDHNAVPPPLRGRLGGGEPRTLAHVSPPLLALPARGRGPAEFVLAVAFLLLTLPFLFANPAIAAEGIGGPVDPFVYRFMVFVMAIFVGYYVVWSVTPALHTPLMSVTNAISSVIVVGALLAVGINAITAGGWLAKIFGFLALVMASVNIFGGFLVTSRMLAMYKKKDAKK